LEYSAKELSHSPEVLCRKTAHVWELGPQVGGKAFQDDLAPADRLLFFHDTSVDVPVEQECGGEPIRKGPFLMDRKSKELFTIFDCRAGRRLGLFVNFGKRACLKGP
jgi:hypothetical protein